MGMEKDSHQYKFPSPALNGFNSRAGIQVPTAPQYKGGDLCHY